MMLLLQPWVIKHLRYCQPNMNRLIDRIEDNDQGNNEIPLILLMIYNEEEEEEDDNDGNDYTDRDDEDVDEDVDDDSVDNGGISDDDT